MPKGLAVSDVVNVTVNLSPIPAQFRNFGALLIVGPSSVIDVNERYRLYTNITGVTNDFSTTAPEFLAAQLFLEQSPQPSIVYIGRWAQTATNGLLHTSIFTPIQALLANFTAVTSGAFGITVDGVPLQISGLNFSAATNLNGVASILQTALAAQATGATVVWNGNLLRFDISSGTTGILSSVSLGRSPTAKGSFLFASQPANNSTLTLNGTVVTFVTATPTGNQVLIGATLPATLANLLSFLQSSADVQLTKFRYWVSGSTLYVESVLTGVAGAGYTIVAGTSPASNATASGATLSGGTGTDISAAPLLLTTATGAPAPVNGVAAETLLNCVSTMMNVSGDWYGLQVASLTLPVLADHIAVANLIEAAAPNRIYGITSQDTACLDPTRSDDVASQIQSLGLNRTFVQYSSWSPYAAASMYGRAFTVNFDGNNTTLTLKFKQEPGVVAELLTETYAAALKTKNCNVFVQYMNNTAIIQEGVMSGGYYFDERHGADWFQNRLQTDEYNLLYTSPTKIPQTDAGIQLLVTVAEKSCAAAVNNGLCAPGVWNVAGFGSLQQGDTLPSGFYVYAPPVATQAPSDRAARKSVPIQVALKLAGAIHSANLLVTVNR